MQSGTCGDKALKLACRRVAQTFASRTNNLGVPHRSRVPPKLPLLGWVSDGAGTLRAPAPTCRRCECVRDQDYTDERSRLKDT